jgi:hypothetical protein
MTHNPDPRIIPTAAVGEEVRREMARVSAVSVLSFARQKHPGLRHAEAAARLDLAAAIIAMDAVDEQIEAGEKIHGMNEQAAVEHAQQVYAQALADLVRGEAS